MTVLSAKPVETRHAALRPELTCRALSLESAEMVMVSWRELERRLDSKCVTSGATWVDCWLNVYSSHIPCRFLIGEAGGVIRGICLLTSGQGQKSGPLSVQTCHLGTAGEGQPGSVCVEYNDILVEPEYRQAFIAEIAATIHADRNWEQLRLDGFSEPELQAWLTHFPNAEIRHRDSRYYNLQAARVANMSVIDRLGKSTRSNLRRRLKQYGELTCDWAETVEQAEEIFHELISLHQARWHAVGQPGAFASQQFREFQLSASLRLFLEEKAVLFRVRHQGDTVGCLLLLVDQNRLLDYLSGFADFNVKPSPGLTTHYLCMNEALQRGYDAYDFLVGDKRHKDNLSTDVNQLCWLTWSRPSLKLRAIRTLQKVKQWVQQRRQKSTEKTAVATESE